jgi:hypothetical protein
MSKIVLAHVLAALALVLHPEFQGFLVEDPLHQFSWIAGAFPCAILGTALVWGRLKF